jgi:hypothetical protein
METLSVTRPTAYDVSPALGVPILRSTDSLNSAMLRLNKEIREEVSTIFYSKNEVSLLQYKMATVSAGD